MRHKSTERWGAEWMADRSGYEDVDVQREYGAEDDTPEANLQIFRAQLYASFGRRADALFELTDAILAGLKAVSPGELYATRP